MSRLLIQVFYIGIAALTTLGCSHTPTEPERSAQTTAPEPVSSQTKFHEVGTWNGLPNYFPLHDENRWVYVTTGLPADEKSKTDMVEVKITGRRRIDGNQVYDLANYLFPYSDRPTQFYNEFPGRTMELWNGKSGLWYPWSQFTGLVEIPISIPDFDVDGIHGSIGTYFGSSTVTVPAGTFQGAAAIYYNTDGYADFGLVRDVLAPDVGLIERTITTIAGEVTWSLMYAEVGQRTWGDVR